MAQRQTQKRKKSNRRVACGMDDRDERAVLNVWVRQSLDSNFTTSPRKATKAEILVLQEIICGMSATEIETYVNTAFAESAALHTPATAQDDSLQIGSMPPYKHKFVWHSRGAAHTREYLKLLHKLIQPPHVFELGNYESPFGPNVDPLPPHDLTEKSQKLTYHIIPDAMFDVLQLDIRSFFTAMLEGHEETGKTKRKRAFRIVPTASIDNYFVESCTLELATAHM